MKLRQWLRIKSYPSVPFHNRQAMPKESGIYYAMRGLEILYLGQSSDLYERWNGKYQHHKTYQLIKYGCRVIHFRRVPEHRLSWVEAREIERLNPEFNIQKPKPGHWLTPNLIFEFTGEWMVKAVLGAIGLAMFLRLAWLIIPIIF